MSCEFTHLHQCDGQCGDRTSVHTHLATANAATHPAQPGGYPWDDITALTTGHDPVADELEADLADAALGLLMTLILVSATAFAAGFVFARFIE